MSKPSEQEMARFRAGMDQEWAEACDWFDGSDKVQIKALVDAAAEDEPHSLMTHMRRNPAYADSVQRLVLLAFHEISVRHLQREADRG